MPGSFVPPIRRRAVLAGAAVVLGTVLSGCGFTVRRTSGPPTFTPEELVDGGEFSTLDELGIARAKASQSLRLDFREGTIAKADVGLPDSSYGPDVVANKGEKLQLTIRGTTGTLEADTDHVRFFTTDTSPELSVITYFLTAETLDEYGQLLRDAVSDYGLDSEAVERWIEGTRDDPGGKSSYAVGVGDSLGFDVGYDLRYDGGKEIQVIIVSVSKLS
ncbi:hypothetical protein MB46_18490 [Arthrobacter alpinus]|uniref:hypothetical protein n=1 Tax=Arthrobacter alpinus TaxID=656366 RepID=UPI0006791E6E|nr:hypothetical protein [Arthrobacter alpinus]ALV47182.1 hypothetical protein MB46_18490 [Arthrobacter alpinus]